jgi:hypothetical protein
MSFCAEEALILLASAVQVQIGGTQITEHNFDAEAAAALRASIYIYYVYTGV